MWNNARDVSTKELRVVKGKMMRKLSRPMKSWKSLCWRDMLGHNSFRRQSGKRQGDARTSWMPGWEIVILEEKVERGRRRWRRRRRRWRGGEGEQGEGGGVSDSLTALLSL